ncbi:protein NEN1-like isoform X2 [Citrus sinensis]|uniref:protein NEN1 isoform X2 n=1 Tax=Citrus clementina TaxID=85681 RepID=UPI000CED6A53|nr:protein NEN1 isoform X2 [Citrus x clementina]XP_052292878.1 protein NEN1-like isoform X2 [Citrus sinensis]
MDPRQDRFEIAFFDVETAFPNPPGQRIAILEFGAILVCPKTLEELQPYSTLVRPADPSLISSLPERSNGITPDAVASAPPFADIADTVFDILHGRIWAGHNILEFDCARIREAFAEIGQPAPEPKGTIDSLALLTQRFGRRAGDMKLASLATYFGLGQQTHRSLEDVRMNLEVLKYCATVLFLLYCSRLKIRYGISTRFVDQAGRPRLSFVVDASQSLCTVLDACEVVAKKLFEDSRSNSEWNPVVTRQSGFDPTARLRIPTVVFGDVAQYATEMYRKEPSGDIQKLEFVRFDAAELDSLLKPGTFVDAFLSLDPYDYVYEQSAGIRLVAKKLIIHSE